MPFWVKNTGLESFTISFDAPSLSFCRSLVSTPYLQVTHPTAVDKPTNWIHLSIDGTV
jgi:hypothetical protein